MESPAPAHTAAGVQTQVQILPPRPWSEKLHFVGHDSCWSVSCLQRRLRVQEERGLFHQVAAWWGLRSCGIAAPHAPVPHLSSGPLSQTGCPPPYQRCDGLVSHVVAGGRVILNQLPVLHVQPPANAVDLPGEQGMLRASGSLGGQQHVPHPSAAGLDPGTGGCISEPLQGQAVSGSFTPLTGA